MLRTFAGWDARAEGVVREGTDSRGGSASPDFSSVSEATPYWLDSGAPAPSGGAATGGRNSFGALPPPVVSQPEQSITSNTAATPVRIPLPRFIQISIRLNVSNPISPLNRLLKTFGWFRGRSWGLPFSLRKGVVPERCGDYGDVFSVCCLFNRFRLGRFGFRFGL